MKNWKLYQLKINFKKLYEDIVKNESVMSLISDSNQTGFDWLSKNNYRVKKTINIFSLFSIDPEWYNLYNEIIWVVHDYLKFRKIDTSNGLWLRTWPVFLKNDLRLTSHRHDWSYFAYICLNDTDSDTVFTDSENGKELYRIKNIPGQMYIGEGRVYHHVETKNNYLEPRITLGCDIETSGSLMLNEVNFIPIPNYALK